MIPGVKSLAPQSGIDAVVLVSGLIQILCELLVSLSSTLYKSMTIGLDKKPYNAELVGGASCPAVMVLETATDFFTGQPKRPDG